MKIHSLSTPLCRWRGLKCLRPQNTSGISGVNSVAAKSNTIEVTVIKQQKRISILLMWCRPSVREPWNSNFTLNEVIYSVFLDWMSSVTLVPGAGFTFKRLSPFNIYRSSERHKHKSNNTISAVAWYHKCKCGFVFVFKCLGSAVKVPPVLKCKLL